MTQRLAHVEQGTCVLSVDAVTVASPMETREVTGQLAQPGRDSVTESKSEDGKTVRKFSRSAANGWNRIDCRRHFSCFYPDILQENFGQST